MTTAAWGCGLWRARGIVALCDITESELARTVFQRAGGEKRKVGQQKKWRANSSALLVIGRKQLLACVRCIVKTSAHDSATVSPSHDPQGSKKKNLNKQEMSKYLRFIVQRMKERVRRTVPSFPVSLMPSVCGAALTLLAEPGRTSVAECEGTETNLFLQRTGPARSG